MTDSETSKSPAVKENDITNELKEIERIRPRNYFFRLLGLLGTGTFFDAYDATIIGSVLVVLIKTLHLSYIQVGSLAGAAYIGQFFGAWIFGYISERFGRKTAYITAVMEMSIFTILTGLAWNYLSFYWLRLIAGFGMGGEVPVAASLISEFAPTKKRGYIVLQYEIIFAWALFATPLVAALVYSLIGQALGWRVLFFLASIPLAAGIIAIFALYESPRWLLNNGRIEEARAIIEKLKAKMKPQEKEDVSTTEAIKTLDSLKVTPQKTSWLEFFSKEYRRRTAFIWTMWFTSYFVIYGLLIWLPTEYHTIGGLPTSLSLLATALGSGTALIIGYIMTFTVDRVGRKTWSIIGYSISIAGLIFGIIATLVYHDYHWPVLLATALPGFMGMGGVMGLLLYTYTPELFPTRMRGWATSGGTSLLRLATIISTYVVGAVLATTAVKYLELGWVFTIFLIVILVGLIVLVTTGIETKQQVLEKLSP